MSVQASSYNSVIPFILSGSSFAKEAETILQDAGRTLPLAPFTLMAKIAATGKWVPFTNAAASDGTAVPQGIYMGDEITAAALVAGDVVNCPILVGGSCTIDRSQLVIENSLTLATLITVGTTDIRTVEERLRAVGIFVEDTVDIDG